MNDDERDEYAVLALVSAGQKIAVDRKIMERGTADWRGRAVTRLVERRWLTLIDGDIQLPRLALELPAAKGVSFDIYFVSDAALQWHREQPDPLPTGGIQL